MLGMGASRNSSSYPASMKVYICTKNSDGTVTVTNNVVGSPSSSSTDTNTPFNLEVDNLDTKTIYKVEASVYNAYLYEIAFRTPMNTTVLSATSQEFSGANKQLSFDTIIGEPQTKSFTVTGTDLQGDVTATLNDANGVFSIGDQPTITIAQTYATNGYQVDVTFNSTTAGTFTGYITLSSPNAQDVTVNLNGIAHAPSLTADPEELTFETQPGTPITRTFDVLGEYLKGDVTLTLTGAAEFAISSDGTTFTSPITLTKAQAEEGKTITVKFSPTANGEYSGTVTLNSTGLEQPVVVTLNGSAYPDGFDVVVGTYGVTTLYADFPLTIPYDTYEPDLLGVFIASTVDSKTKEVRLRRLERDIPANTGVVVMGNAGTYRFPTNHGTVSELPSDNLLYGSTVKTTPAEALKLYQKPDGIIMTLGKGSSGYIGFYKYTGKNLAANKAFLIYEPTGQSYATAFSISGFDDLTGIRDLGIVSNSDEWHTLQGIKLKGAPLQRGIYIHNGKTVVVK